VASKKVAPRAEPTSEGRGWRCSRRRGNRERNQWINLAEKIR
jgi:hypothetical protein